MGKSKVTRLRSATHPMEDPVSLTVKVPRGVVEFYQDLAKFNCVKLEELLNDELQQAAKSIIDTLPEEAYFHKKTMLSRYGLE